MLKWIIFIIAVIVAVVGFTMENRKNFPKEKSSFHPEKKTKSENKNENRTEYSDKQDSGLGTDKLAQRILEFQETREKKLAKMTWWEKWDEYLENGGENDEPDIKFIALFEGYNTYSEDPDYQEKLSIVEDLYREGSELAACELASLMVEGKYRKQDLKRAYEILRTEAKKTDSVLAKFQYVRDLLLRNYIPSNITEEEIGIYFEETTEYAQELLEMGYEKLFIAAHALMPKYSRQHAEFLRTEVFEPAWEDLEDSTDAKDLDTKGLFYLFGIYCKQDFEKAKALFLDARSKGLENEMHDGFLLPLVQKNSR